MQRAALTVLAFAFLTCLPGSADAQTRRWGSGQPQSRNPEVQWAKPSVALLQQYENAIAKPGRPERAVTQYEEAADVARIVVLTSACTWKNESARQMMARYLAPGNTVRFPSAVDGGLYIYSFPNSGMQYHPEGVCVEIDRVDSWKSPAPNILAFRVVFVSGESDEVAHRYFVFMRQPDGTWMLRHMEHYSPGV